MSTYIKVALGGTIPPDELQPTREVCFTDSSGYQILVNFDTLLALDEAATVLANMRDEEYRRVHRWDHLAEEIARDESDRDDYEWPEEAVA